MRFLFSSSRATQAGIGILVGYTAYTSYVHLRTNYEISERERKKQFESDLEKYVEKRTTQTLSFYNFVSRNLRVP
jgi:hypothetical protein